jgi:hypothetical protein
LALDDLVVSSYDIDFEYHIDLSAEFTMADQLVQDAPSNTETFSKSIAYEVEACFCDDSNTCVSISNVPAIPMGGEVRICIKIPPTDDDFEILAIMEWKLEQENTGVLRYAIQDTLVDGLTTVQSVNPHEFVASTALDSQFFQEPENGVTLYGLVLIQPRESANGGRRFVRSLYDETEPAAEGRAMFSIALELLDPSKKEISSGVSHASHRQVSDGIIVVASFAVFSLITILVVRRYRHPRDRVSTTGVLYHNEDNKNDAQFDDLDLQVQCNGSFS